MNSNPAEIGLRIKEARKAAKLSQTELADMLNKTLRTVQKYESGEIEPSIATINSIAGALNVSPAELIGYQKQELRLDTLSDVLFVLNELNKKAGLRFDIDVRRPPHYDEWTCSVRFNGNDATATYNADLCLFMERYAAERERLESYWTNQEAFDDWFERELAYYANSRLTDKEVEVLSFTERIKRRDALVEKFVEDQRKQKKAAEENGDQ
ncbi:MAG: helix-turn-helix transcriptional regulator [Oscillospiraceae bacterium]|nr:helix-turn-helix transcriptional regulator [Oscillospiraceae bacterium]